ncbi:MAG: hypothetical protein ACTSWZ_02740 [Candidatus Heimdallarchaeaceae archaeon]
MNEAVGIGWRRIKSQEKPSKGIVRVYKNKDSGAVITIRKVKKPTGYYYILQGKKLASSYYRKYKLKTLNTAIKLARVNMMETAYENYLKHSGFDSGYEAGLYFREYNKKKRWPQIEDLEDAFTNAYKKEKRK